VRRPGTSRRDRGTSIRERRPSTWRSSALWVALTLAPGGLACELIDAGPPQGVPGRCVVSTDFFVAEVHPNFLVQHDCAKSGCHDEASSGSLYVLKDVSGELTPLPGDPLSTWPEGWQFNFEQTSSQITDCDIAELSPLYSKPAGGDTQAHEGGDNFAAGGDELDLIQQWLTSGD
jgi:hypothetical protein